MSAGAGAAELDLEIPSKPEYVGTARHTVAALAYLHGLSDNAVEDVKLAVSEACTHAVVVSARSEGEGEPVRIRARLEDRGLLIEVLDRGPGIDRSLLERDPEFDSQEFTFERGLSLPLVEGLVDELSIAPREGGGSVLTMLVPAPGDEGEQT